MAGVGITPEAIEVVPAMFDAILEMGWRTLAPDPKEWLQQYAVRRYGRYSPNVSQAYGILQARNMVYDK
jgi:alpha-N-acetylglucosaminidase